MSKNWKKKNCNGTDGRRKDRVASRGASTKDLITLEIFAEMIENVQNTAKKQILDLICESNKTLAQSLQILFCDL